MTYDPNGPILASHVYQDMRYALRTIRRSPVFAAAVILTLALGIGANAALFTVTRGVLMRTLPVERPDELVEIGCINPNNPDDACRTHYPGFLLFRESTSLETDPAEAWRTSLIRRSRAPLARTLVAGQIALTMVLLSSAGLFIKSLAIARNVDPGFDSEHLLTVTVAPGMAGYDAEAAMAYLRRVIAAAEALPGVRSATYNAVALATGVVSQTGVSLPGVVASSDQMVTGQNRVGPRFAETVGLRLIAGRDLTAEDQASQRRVAVVNERFARQFFQTIDVLGRTFTLSHDRQEYAIVAVVADAHDRSVLHPTENWVYVPFAPEPRMKVTVRTSDGVLPVSAALEKVIQAVDPAVPVYGVQAVSTQIAETLRRERLLATLGTVFGALALGLVAIGLYATFAGMVSRRTREIGIRMAIGANASRIARLLAREAAIIALSGLGVGMAAAIAAASGIRHQLFNVAPTDARVLAAATVVLVAATAMAVSIPALRAVRIRAVDAIRVE